MIVYKKNIQQLLKDHGYNTKKILKEHYISGQTFQNIRTGGNITLKTLNDICLMCRCQPGDLIEVIPTDEEKIKFF